MQPWARVEGTVYVDGRPAAKAEINLKFDDDGMELARNPWGQISPGRFLYYDYRTHTDDKGHFVLDRVRGGSAKISRMVIISQTATTRSMKYADTRTIDITAGKTLTVNLGKPDDESKPPADSPSGKVGQGQSDPRGSATPAASSPAPPVASLPRRTHLFNDKYSAVAVQTEKHVNFVLVYRGSLSSGMMDWYTEKLWGFEGSVYLVDKEKTARSEEEC